MLSRTSLALLASCSSPSMPCRTGRSEPCTPYRKSGADPNARIHRATFDVSDSHTFYNDDNCGIAPRLLNANVQKLTDGEQP